MTPAATTPSADDCPDKNAFSLPLICWQKRHGRHNLPWQQDRDAYRVWLSEIMLQQTQVGTVIPYYARFLERFPTIRDLADAPLEAVLEHWSGLGYYARARNLHRCAGEICASFQGVFPKAPEKIAALPGIGPSTAAAIAVFAYGVRAAILDGNVKRVLTRYFAIRGFPGSVQTERTLWTLAEALLPEQDIEAYTQGLMDLGATLCLRSNPLCAVCPVQASCVACREGSQRDFPSTRPKKDLPKRDADFLALTDGGRVLLLRRPPLGIWGGLLALPEGAAEEAAELAARHGGRLLKTQAMTPMKHTFTHFRLTLRVLLCFVAIDGCGVAEAGWEWMAYDRIDRAALPTPIRRLLKIARQTIADDGAAL